MPYGALRMNGIIWHEKKLIYFFIPKNGCTSLKKVFADGQGLTYSTPHAANFDRCSPEMARGMAGYHTFSSAISQMKGLLISGGLLFIQGFENEADNEQWAGLHQWNIRAQGEEGIVISGWHGSNETFVPGKVKTIELPSEKTWFYYEYRL